jgi:hypothetical protein
MRVLLTDGSGLTAKQTALRLGGEGHRVDVLAPKGLNLTRFTRHVRGIHHVPPYGPDPLAWLDAALAIWDTHDFDLLLPTQEQVAVLASARQRLTDHGVITIVPSFDALASVQDKVSAYRTLQRLDLPQPESVVVERSGDLTNHDHFPVFVKLPIGTATSGVQLVRTGQELAHVAAALQREGAFRGAGVLIQTPVDGPLVMVQTVFDHGRLMAFHACLRVAEGINGGASHKRSLHLPEARTGLEALGRGLGWHGALSADIIVGQDGPVIIDVNPRLVEPGNALASGVDLVGAMVEIALGRPVSTGPSGRSGVNTHQLLLAVLGEAKGDRSEGSTRRTALRTSPYRPLRGQQRRTLTHCTRSSGRAPRGPRRGAATLVRPATYSWFTDGSVANYALTSGGWQAITDAAAVPPRPDWPR